MTARQHFARCLQDRRNYQRGSAEWIYLTAAARTYLNIIRKIPAQEWKAQ